MHVASHKDSPGNTTKFFRGQTQLISEHWSWNPTNSLQSTFGSNLSELRNPFWVDYYLAYLTTTNFYDQPMFESRNICDLGLLQNARTHGPRGTVKTIEKPILRRTQVHYFCSGISLQDLYYKYSIVSRKTVHQTYISHHLPNPKVCWFSWDPVKMCFDQAMFGLGDQLGNKRGQQGNEGRDPNPSAHSNQDALVQSGLCWSWKRAIQSKAG